MWKSADERPLFWIGSSKRDLLDLPEEVVKTFGFALGLAQNGQKHHKAKPMKGYGAAGVLEVVEDHRGNTYRAVYTVRFEKAIYSLHVFQKKSTRGIATPRHEIELINQRMKQAQAHYENWRTTCI
jgi:phage-related protein